MEQKNILAILLFSLVSLTSVQADCVYGAKNKTSFKVLGSSTILLSGGYGQDILIKTYSYFYSTSDVTVLKDSFCSYDSAVLHIDGEVVDAQSVTSL
jgi:hypothetical protein